MDLSNLSSNLPLSHPINDDSIDEINKELSNEFKIGARSIAALYRLSNSKTSIVQAKGYLNCLNDLLALIDNGSVQDLSQLKSLLLFKRSELIGENNLHDNMKSEAITNPSSSPKKSVEDKQTRIAADQPSQKVATEPVITTSGAQRQEDSHTQQHSSNSNHNKESVDDYPPSLKNYEFNLKAETAPFNFPPSRAPLSLHPQSNKYYTSHHNHNSSGRITKNNKIKEYNLNFKARHGSNSHNNKSNNLDYSSSDVEEVDDMNDDDDEMVLVDGNQSMKRRLNESISSAKKLRFEH
ncbi:unnamed protein product [Ambrosiozyma monospora]|uniref:Unnamed protein product n=1 Tax=Ambrosiozyma monospora TaxID=43982 RepID=A0A9W6YSQ8_AMBMO|nr:unnamed protein product [Ambrosiozyma monospora]